MVRKLKIKLIKKSNKCFFIVVSLNKNSVKSFFIEKLGTVFIIKKKKYVFFNIKKFLLWLNKGALINSYVLYIFSIIFKYNFLVKSK